FHELFKPKGTNVNFVQKLGESSIRVRTYERGVEGETLACGTGVCAAALVASELKGMTSPVSVRVQGGDDLEVIFDRAEDGGFSNIRLKGPADFAFSGEITLG
ncbi:diaminopimelate epimerase, partial [Verrucomicrobia bacterium]|nr:diaminopimelate epimerase [Verrucomicrobiota bacterium]